MMVFHAFKCSNKTSQSKPTVFKTFTVNAKLMEGLILTTDKTIIFFAKCMIKYHRY